MKTIPSSVVALSSGTNLLSWKSPSLWVIHYKIADKWKQNYINAAKWKRNLYFRPVLRICNAYGNLANVVNIYQISFFLLSQTFVSKIWNRRLLLVILVMICNWTLEM